MSVHICDCDNCSNEAKYFDDMFNYICEECMEREVDEAEDVSFEDFIPI